MPINFCIHFSFSCTFRPPRQTVSKSLKRTAIEGSSNKEQGPIEQQHLRDSYINPYILESSAIRAYVLMELIFFLVSEVFLLEASLRELSFTWK